MNSRDTPTTYSAEEAARISQAVKDGDGDPVCPRCGTQMKLGPKITSRATITQEIICPDCKRCVMFSHQGKWGTG